MRQNVLGLLMGAWEGVTEGSTGRSYWGERGKELLRWAREGVTEGSSGRSYWQEHGKELLRGAREGVTDRSVGRSYWQEHGKELLMGAREGVTYRSRDDLETTVTKSPPQHLHGSQNLNAKAHNMTGRQCEARECFFPAALLVWASSRELGGSVSLQPLHCLYKLGRGWALYTWSVLGTSWDSRVVYFLYPKET